MIKSAGYDAQQQMLEIEFANNGQIWQFDNVPEDIWYRFRKLIQKSERRLGTGEIARYDYISCQHLYLFFYVSVPAPYIPERLCDEM